MHLHIQPLPREILVHRVPGPLPVPVVVHDEHAPHGEARPELLQLVPRRFVPVGVEPQQGNALRRRRRQRLLDPARYEHDLFPGIERADHRLPHFLEAAVGADHLGLRRFVAQPVLGRPIVEVAIHGLRRRHAGECVEQEKLAAGRVELHEREGRGHHAASLPDAALNHGAGDSPGLQVSNALAHRHDPIEARHRVRPHLPIDGAVPSSHRRAPEGRRDVGGGFLKADPVQQPARTDRERGQHRGNPFPCRPSPRREPRANGRCKRTCGSPLARAAGSPQPNRRRSGRSRGVVQPIELEELLGPAVAVEQTVGGPAQEVIRHEQRLDRR